MNKEDHFIQQFTNQTNLIGDDAAVIGEMVYSQDAFFENVHFKKDWMSLKQIAAKSMLVNISDAIAMNAIPQYALLTVAIPAYYSTSDMRKLANGFKKVAKDYNIKIIGGDTISNEKLDISVTIISKSENPIFRNGAKKDDLVCYTGDLGTCKKDLKKLFKGKKISSKSKFIKPKLKDNFFYEIAKYVNASLDISDGLFFELERLSKSSKVGFEFFDKISENIGTSGEEYEMLFTFPKKYLEKIMAASKKHNIALNIFAKVIEGKYETKYKNHHFNKRDNN
ncbi:thiamine-phosphate kinase [Malaciobacter molluscorum LMG 25693]|uniref:Thiamine-monophosphate kinase n=1 Tax=Malaciobacter molluscorum LMG 25693 TaxID=870501 RepID=A0A2G1DI98_9BACT|nr:thiamine-phosphate kinase [Malaciobacter molluscorum]AXX91814.1 thiamine monophosphate kinase [Malaciobacter molluscorum LMG 25693]PHO18223.1 thiamine-phosphate kinase [Malaciobacter molluscorum LMG 25693]